ncbi:hypothetical protein [Methylibium sp.]|uniref:hypothetical protein n=1 Tax=Methylibium sp. TaxID=2067992 RepID=UPI00184482EA|nr:hypothetical protein [Methylibium sp.]MBA3588494.1 hypothetical protein [Methylibium sp.]
MTTRIRRWHLDRYVAIAPPPRPAPDFTALYALPVPVREASVRYQRLVRQAVVRRSEGILGALLIEVACLVHPSDRDVSGWQPALLGLDAWERVGQGWGDDVRAFVAGQGER